MADGWLSPATIVASWSAVAATAASWIAWRVYKVQMSVDVPVLLCEIKNDTKAVEWQELFMTLRNTTDTKWKVESYYLRAPRGTVGISQWNMPKADDGLNSGWDMKAAQKVASNPVLSTLRADPVGTPRHQHLGGGDVGWERIYLLRSSMRSSKLSMRATLVSTDAMERRITIDIKRQLPAAPATATS